MAARNGMGDFYSVLKQSIIDRGLSTPEAREEAYAQARRAMINRLWSYEPPLAEDEIDHRIGQFDIAVGQIEHDLVETFAAMQAEAYDAEDAYHGADDHGYAPTFGGTGASPEYDNDSGHDGGPPEAVPAPRKRHSIEERSRAVERALSGIDEAAFEAALHAPDDDAGAAWDEHEAPAEHDDAPEPYVEPEPAAANRAAPPRAAPKAGKAETATERGKPPAPAATSASASGGTVRHKMAAALPSDRRTGLYALIGVVALLCLALVGGIAWVLLGPSTPATPVVLETNVPGGVSGPDTAIRLPKEAIAVTNSFSLFDGKDPTVFQGDPDNPVRFDGELARISTSAASPGAKVIIGAGLSSRLAGRTMRVTIEARSARENGAASMRFAYESGVALSHWQTANLSPNFTELGLVWRVPTLRTSPTGDFIDIEPGIPGSGTAVEIKSVRVDMVDE
jgi:hypothetical protein